MTHPASPLVSAGWLIEHQHDEHLVVLDASITRGEDEQGRTVFSDGTATYRAGHLPGAVFADLFGVWSDPEGEFGFTRPTATQVESAARAAGIGPDSMVVLYDQLSGAYAARLWLVLTSWGFENVRVLDGGFAAWQAAGGPIEVGPGPEVQPGAGITVQDTGVFADLDEVQRLALNAEPSSSQPQLVCALRRPEFLGDPARERSGHIPGSLNLPYPDLLAPDGTVSTARTRAYAAELGLATDTAVVAYCGGGVNAAGLALAFVEAGLAMPRVYDASLNQWRARTDLPVELGAGGAAGSPRETLVVFDIDGTLLLSDGDHNETITQVLAQHGLDATVKPFGSYSHYTDSCVISEVHEATHGAPASAEFLDRMNGEYRRALEQRLAGRAIVEVPGAARVVKELTALPGTHVAFATGSLRGMAELKLSLVGVDAHDAVLSTASEGYTREEIVRAAVAGIVSRIGHDRLDVVILGDGAWDEKTAQGLGIPFVGLSTGRHRFGPQAVRVLDDYTDVGAHDLLALARPWSDRSH